MSLFGSMIHQRQMRQADSRNAKVLAKKIVQQLEEQIDTKNGVIASDRWRHRAQIVTDFGEGFPVSMKNDFGRSARVERIINDCIFQQLTANGVDVMSSQLAWDWYDPSQEESVIVTAQVWFKP